MKENENLKQSNVVLIQSTNPELLKISQSICRYKEKMKESKLLLNDEDIVKECLDNNFEEINELKKENENLKNKIKNLEEEIKVKTKETETKILSLSQKYSDSEEEEFDINFLAKNAKEKNNSEDIKIEKLLSLIRGDLNIKRKTVVKNVFEFNDKEKKRNIKLNEIKQLYNSKMHPDAYVGYKKESDVYKEFCYTFDIFCIFYEIYEYITLEQFIEYYKGISASIIDDNYFDDVLNGVWNINIVQMIIL